MATSKRYDQAGGMRESGVIEGVGLREEEWVELFSRGDLFLERT